MRALPSILATSSDWLGIRPGERREAFFACVTLLLVIAGHAMLETARDTLFLSDLPVTRLPWAYLTIAVLSLGLGAAATVLARRPRGRTLSLTLVGAAVVNVGFWAAAATRRPELLFAFYVWTGLVASVATLQFWLRAGDVFDVARAKRLFAIVGAGGLAGATLGAALAGLVLLVAAPRALVAGGAAFFVVAALVNERWGATRAEPPGAASDSAPARTGPRTRLRRDPYFWRILVLTLVATLVVTGVDYLFKSVVAREVPRAGLGHFLARYQTGVNAAALVFQLALASRLLHGLGVVGALAVLPLLLLAATSAAAVVGGLAPVLVVKAIDGTMRHSLDRAGTEILYLPLSDEIRERVKAITIGVGQRGGQALASVAILVTVAMGSTPAWMAGGLAVLSAVWLASLVGLRGHYVGRFRRQLRTLSVGAQGSLPPLDLRSLEVLVAALGSQDDAEVIAALDMLEAYGKTHLVSPMLVHHPSREVARRAIALFVDSSDPQVLRFLDRVLQHDDDEVRAAALQMRTARDPDEALLRRHLRNARSPVVRCTALVGLVSAGFADDREAELALHEVVEHATAEASPILARALRDLPPRFARPLARELGRSEPRFAVEVAKALASEPSPIFLDTSIALLVHRDARMHARAALVALGSAALERLGEALHDPDTPDAVRLHLPRSISRFASPRAAAILVDALVRERDERVRYKILRGLGRMRADDPTLPIDEEALRAVAGSFLERAIVMLGCRVAWDLLEATGAAHTRGHALLLPALLAEEERRALESVFRTLHVVEPAAEYAIVCRGLAATDSTAWAGSRELLENLLHGSLRPGLLAMTDSLPPPARLAAVLEVHEPPSAALLRALGGRDSRDPEASPSLVREVLEGLLADPSVVMRSIAEWQLDGVAWGPDAAAAGGGPRV